MRNSKGVSLIALIITIIVIIILAAIVLSAGGDTTNRAQLAVFTNNFSQYYDRVTMDALNAKQTLGIRSENVNDAQLYYMVANGLRTASGDSETTNRTLPVGYVMPKTIGEIYGLKTDAERESVVAYVIDDTNITGYGQKGNNTDGSAGYEFYGDTNGEEYHFITSTGHVFTVPGFALTVDDGTIQYYISNEKGCYYVAKGNSNIEKGKPNVNGDIVKEEDPILATDFLNKASYGSDGHPAEEGTGLYGLTSRKTAINSYGDITTDALTDAAGNSIAPTAFEPKAGRYTAIGGYTTEADAGSKLN
jgi:type II secretory pathway pseudopilin PulG